MNEVILRVFLGREISVIQVLGFLRDDIGVVVHGIFISALLITIFYHRVFRLRFVCLSPHFCLWLAAAKLWLGPQLGMNHVTPSGGVCAVVPMVVTMFGGSG